VNCNNSGTPAGCAGAPAAGAGWVTTADEEDDDDSLPHAASEATMTMTTALRDTLAAKTA